MLFKNYYKLFPQTIYKPLKQLAIYTVISYYHKIMHQTNNQIPTSGGIDLTAIAPNFVNLSQSYTHQLTKQSKS
jgi:hypothetical protein